MPQSIRPLVFVQASACVSNTRSKRNAGLTYVFLIGILLEGCSSRRCDGSPFAIKYTPWTRLFHQRLEYPSAEIIAPFLCGLGRRFETSTEFSTRRKWGLKIFLLLRRCLYKEFVGFLLGRNQALGKNAAIVLRHTILPLQKISDALRFDPNLDPPQAGEEKIHLVLKTQGGTKVLRRTLQRLDPAAVEFEQTPTAGKFIDTQKTLRGKIIAFAADAVFRLLAPGFGTVSEKIPPRHFAFHQHRMAGLFPSNGVRHLAADARLLAQYHSAAVLPQPLHRH